MFASVFNKLSGFLDVIWSCTLAYHSHLTSINSDSSNNSLLKEKLFKIGCVNRYQGLGLVIVPTGLFQLFAALCMRLGYSWCEQAVSSASFGAHCRIGEMAQSPHALLRCVFSSTRGHWLGCGEGLHSMHSLSANCSLCLSKIGCWRLCNDSSCCKLWWAASWAASAQKSHVADSKSSHEYLCKQF